MNPRVSKDQMMYCKYCDASCVDGFKVTYTPINVIQSNACPTEAFSRRREYYPFGLQTANSWTRDNNSNNFLYNEGSEVNTTSGFYDLPFRNYDASLGRFFQVDPLAAVDHNYSPFTYGRNNPISFNDPSGLNIDYATSWENPDYAFARQEEARIHEMLSSNDWSKDARGGGGNRISAQGYSDAQLRAMYRSQGGNYQSFAAWIGTKVDGFGSGGREIQGTDGRMYTTNDNGEIGYWRDYGYEAGTGDVAVQSKRSEFIVEKNSFYGVPLNDASYGDLKYGAAFTLPGSGITFSFDYYKDDPKARFDLLRHEFGHMLQYQRYGKADYFVVVISSLVSAGSTDDDIPHRENWTEVQANTLSYLHFGMPSDWNTKRYPIDEKYMYSVVMSDFLNNVSKK